MTIDFIDLSAMNHPISVSGLMFGLFELISFDARRGGAAHLKLKLLLVRSRSTNHEATHCKIQHTLLYLY